MKKHKAKRKTTREIYLEGYIRGLSQGIEGIMELWRKNVNPPNFDPLVRVWAEIEKVDKEISKSNLEYNKLLWPRYYGKKFE